MKEELCQPLVRESALLRLSVLVSYIGYVSKLRLVPEIICFTLVISRVEFSVSNPLILFVPLLFPASSP